MKILHAGFFPDHQLGSDVIFRKGMLSHGFEHTEFAYRDIAQDVGVDAMNQLLVEQSRNCDLLFINNGWSLIQPSSLARIRRAGCIVAIWFCDPRPRPEQFLLDILHHCDAFFLTSAGDTLREYHRLGSPGRSAFVLNPSDPDLPLQFGGETASVDPPLFSGTQHSFVGRERQEVWRYLTGNPHVQILGSSKRYFRSPLLQRFHDKFWPAEYLRGEPYIRRIIRCRFGIGVSAYQHVKYYTSDRLSHYLTFGKLYLAYRFPGCDDLYQDGTELVFYSGIEELEHKITYFLNNPEHAEQIGRCGQAKETSAHSVHNIVQMMLEILSTGSSQMFPWVEIYS